MGDRSSFFIILMLIIASLIACKANQLPHDRSTDTLAPRPRQHQPARALGQPPRRAGRRLAQVAGMGNFLVGVAIEASQRGINAAGAASQLANFYGVEGVGMRHRFGALPAPGGMELLAIAGPKALPGPLGFTAGWLGGTVEAVAASLNPLTAATVGSVAMDAASSSGLGTLVGATGLSGLGLGSGMAATALSQATAPLGGIAGPAAALIGAGAAGRAGSGIAAANGAAAPLVGTGPASTILGGAGAAANTALSAAGVALDAKGTVKRSVVGNAATGAGHLLGAAGRFATHLGELVTPGKHGVSPKDVSWVDSSEGVVTTGWSDSPDSSGVVWSGEAPTRGVAGSTTSEAMWVDNNGDGIDDRSTDDDDDDDDNDGSSSNGDVAARNAWGGAAAVAPGSAGQWAAGGAGGAGGAGAPVPVGTNPAAGLQTRQSVPAGAGMPGAAPGAVAQGPLPSQTLNPKPAMVPVQGGGGSSGSGWAGGPAAVPSSGAAAAMAGAALQQPAGASMGGWVPAGSISGGIPSAGGMPSGMPSGTPSGLPSGMPSGMPSGAGTTGGSNAALQQYQFQWAQQQQGYPAGMPTTMPTPAGAGAAAQQGASWGVETQHASPPGGLVSVSGPYQSVAAASGAGSWGRR